ncbi:hypothetical protein CYMTET_22067, partial [Cymbomonas tetramitiformis]
DQIAGGAAPCTRQRNANVPETQPRKFLWNASTHGDRPIAVNPLINSTLMMQDKRVLYAMAKANELDCRLYEHAVQRFYTEVKLMEVSTGAVFLSKNPTDYSSPLCRQAPPPCSFQLPPPCDACHEAMTNSKTLLMLVMLRQGGVRASRLSGACESKACFHGMGALLRSLCVWCHATAREGLKLESTQFTEWFTDTASTPLECSLLRPKKALAGSPPLTHQELERKEALMHYLGASV